MKMNGLAPTITTLFDCLEGMYDTDPEFAERILKAFRTCTAAFRSPVVPDGGNISPLMLLGVRHWKHRQRLMRVLVNNTAPAFSAFRLKRVAEAAFGEASDADVAALAQVIRVRVELTAISKRRFSYPDPYGRRADGIRKLCDHSVMSVIGAHDHCRRMVETLDFELFTLLTGIPCVRRPDLHETPSTPFTEQELIAAGFPNQEERDQWHRTLQRDRDFFVHRPLEVER